MEASLSFHDCRSPHTILRKLPAHVGSPACCSETEFRYVFFRNRPQLELIRRLANQKRQNPVLRIAVIGCSNGAEVYSIIWTIRSAWPDLKVIMCAVDISEPVLEIAQRGAYCLEAPELVEVPIFERMTGDEMQEMFDKEQHRLNLKPWLKEGIAWHLADARDPELQGMSGPQDMVVANNFLCHMSPSDAERCLRNIARLVTPGGYVLVSGINLDVRTQVARDLGWKPVQDLIEQIHDGGSVLRRDWPFRWWGVEPFDRSVPDWQLRYATVFQIR